MRNDFFFCPLLLFYINKSEIDFPGPIYGFIIQSECMLPGMVLPGSRGRGEER
jgi:hypothetical protein